MPSRTRPNDQVPQDATDMNPPHAKPSAGRIRALLAGIRTALWLGDTAIAAKLTALHAGAAPPPIPADRDPAAGGRG